MLLEALSTARDLGRLHDIASVVVRYGMGDVVRRLGVAAVLQRAGRALHWDAASRVGTKPWPQRVREALEELGPTFVKAGQILAGRTDLLPPALTDELSKLHEDATPVPIEELRPQLEEDLGAPPEIVFGSFEDEPLAAASIAQVHRARLHDGTEVVLKARRPGIETVVDADLRLLARLAELVEREMPELRRYRPRDVVHQVARSLRDELDMRVEARHADRLRAIVAPRSDVLVPKIHDYWTCERLVVMDHLHGPSLGSWMRGRQAGSEDAARLARVGVEALLLMVFEHGFFHADPHPGNLIVLRDGRLGLLDFGMVGRLSEERRLEVFDLLVAVVESREDDLVDVLVGWSSDGRTDIPRLTQDCGAFIDRYRSVPLRQLDASTVLRDVAALVRDNDLVLPGDVALLIKVFVTIDSLGRKLDPDFVLATYLEPFVARAVRERRFPIRRMRRALRETARVLAVLPQQLRSTMLRIRRGAFRFEFEVHTLERVGKQIERSANRIAVGLIAAALIVGTAIVAPVAGGPEIFGVSLIGLLLFVGATATGVGLLISILRSGRG